MAWTEDEIDELLVRYLDHELSSDERERFEQLLASQPTLQQKLAAWKTQDQVFAELRQDLPAPRTLGADFVDRVIKGAQARVRELGEPDRAPWIERSQIVEKVDSADRLRARDLDTLDPIERSARPWQRWILGVAAMGIAASLLWMALWSQPKPTMNTLVTEQDIQTLKTLPVVPEASVVVENQSLAIIPPDGEAEKASMAESSIPKIETNDLVHTVPRPSLSPADGIATDRRASEVAALPGSTPKTRDPSASIVGPSLVPNAEQLKVFNDMLANPKGAFLFVIDVSLPSNATDVTSLREILDRHDIAWSSQLEIDESTQSTLAKSRLIAEAGQQGLIPDFVDPKTKLDPAGATTREMVSLIFVKARAVRLDAALIEVMQRTDEFPHFSFDLGFDPPTQELMNELRFIQEASLPNTSKLTEQASFSSMLRRPGKANMSASMDRFFAGPRPSNEMSIETRRQSKLPLGAEMMNPVSYALFVVRHPPSGNSR